MLVGALIGIIHAINVQAAITLDFATSDGGLTATDTGGLAVSEGWKYNPGSWSVIGVATQPASAWLTTPAYVVNVDGLVTGSFTHRFNFESYEPVSFADGGQIQYRIDGGTWKTVTQDLISGVTYAGAVDGLNSVEYGFSGTSSGYSTPSYVTSSFTLGTGTSPFSTGTAGAFTIGNQVEFRFQASWDGNLAATDPNWQVSSLSFNNLTAVPEPATTAAAVSGLLAAFAMLRRPSVRAKLGALIGR